MGSQSPLAQLAERAREVFGLAAHLGREFYDASLSRAIYFDPSIWDRHEPIFNEFCELLLQLRDPMQRPPDGFALVAEQLLEAARIAQRIRTGIVKEPRREAWKGEPMAAMLGIKNPGPPRFTGYMDFYPNLNTVALAGLDAVKAVAKAHRLDDPFAFLDDSPAGDGVQERLTLLDRFPKTLTGHVEFLEWVYLEAREQADALQSNKYSHESISKQLKHGVKWSEAGQRIALLHTLPADLVKDVADVLHRQLAIGTVEQICNLLKPRLDALRDALESGGDAGSTGSLEEFMWQPAVDVSFTKGFREHSHDDLVERLQSEIEKNVVGRPRISVLQSLQDRGCDLLIEWRKAKYGVQLKSNGDVEQSDFSVKTIAQIQDSRQHGLVRLYVLLAADINGMSNLQKVRSMVSRISTMNDPYVIAVPPERVWNLLFAS